MLRKDFTIFHSKAIETTVEVVSNLLCFLSYQFSKLVVVVTEYKKKMVQFK